MPWYRSQVTYVADHGTIARQQIRASLYDKYHLMQLGRLERDEAPKIDFAPGCEAALKNKLHAMTGCSFLFSPICNSSSPVSIAEAAEKNSALIAHTRTHARTHHRHIIYMRLCLAAEAVSCLLFLQCGVASQGLGPRRLPSCRGWPW